MQPGWKSLAFTKKKCDSFYELKYMCNTMVQFSWLLVGRGEGAPVLLGKGCEWYPGILKRRFCFSKFGVGLRFLRF